jgi:hypothetical protein
MMPPQQQRQLLGWTPAAEEAARQERHKEAGAKTLAEVGHNNTNWPWLPESIQLWRWKRITATYSSTFNPWCVSTPTYVIHQPAVSLGS